MMVFCSPHLSKVLTPTPLIVNVLRGKLWDDKCEFDEAKDKSKFRDYEAACDRVKAFYKEQHGVFLAQHPPFANSLP
jgi:hypothetical protein